jgi:uncharacterized protein YdhG (YjbR/CyaY superfamily)
MSRKVLDAHTKELQKYDVKGTTIRFPEAHLLRAGLVKKLVRPRVAEKNAH